MTRVLPHSIEAELSILGGVLIDNGVMRMIPDLEVDDFYSPKHQAVFAAMRTLEAQAQPIDATTVIDELDRAGKLQAVGVALIGEAALLVPSPDRVVAYAEIVVRHRLTRETIRAASDVVDRLLTADHELDEHQGEAALQWATARMASVRSRAVASSVTVGRIVDDRLRDLERIASDRESGKYTLTGVPTGIGVLDRHIGGFQRGIVTIVAARPGMGKSALCIGAADAASEAHCGVHVFSLEDSLARYADRTLARHSRVEPQDMIQGTLNRGQLGDITAAITRLRMRQGWRLSTRSTLTADEIVREVRREADSNGTQEVVIDYVQLVRPFDRRAPRHEQLDEIVTAFAVAAKNDNMAYVVASQLNRRLEERPDKRPVLSDLKESGALEERCKCAVMLYRGAVYGPPVAGRDYKKGEPEPTWGGTDSEWERTIELLVTKNTNGATGDLVADWNGPLTMIS